MPNFIVGEVILVDKPLKWTSFDVVKKLKFQLQKATAQKKIKVGHAGTLDPLATGLLIVCTGKKTKTIESIQSQEKEYTGIIQLGATTPSYDLETTPQNFTNIDQLTSSAIHSEAKGMEGEMDQLPPIFSAKKIDGKRAYDLARAGVAPEMKIKRISIYEFNIEKIDNGEVYFRIRCSKGTYIRSIAYDLGKKLGVGGYLKELRRTGIGEHHVDNAFKIEELQAYVDQHVIV